MYNAESRNDSGGKSKLYDQGNKTKRWDSEVEYVEIPDSKGAKSTKWVRLRLISPWIKEATVWLTSKNNKPFPLTDPDWRIQDADFAKPSAEGSPVRFKQWVRMAENPKTGVKEEEQVRGGAISCKVNVIDRAAQKAGDDRIVKVWRFNASALSELREVADGQNGANAFDPTMGYDIKVRYNSELKGAASTKIEAVSASPLTDEELALVYGVYAVKVSAEAVAKIRKKGEGVKTLLKAGFKKKDDGSLTARLNGFAVSQILQVTSALEGAPYDAKTRTMTFKFDGVSVMVKAVTEGQAYDLEAMWFPTSPEEFTRSLKMNNYYIEGEGSEKRRGRDDEDEDDRPKKKRRRDEDDEDEDERPKSRRSRRDEDDEDDEPKSRRRKPVDDDDDEDDGPPPKSGKRGKPVVEDDDEDDEDEPPPKARGKAKSKPVDDEDDEPAPKGKGKPSKGKVKPADDDDEDSDDEDDEPPPRKPSKLASKTQAGNKLNKLRSRR